MPIGDFEQEVLRLLAANRNPESFVGGATVLHQPGDIPRKSQDVDFFHDTIISLAQSAEKDVLTLQGAGYEVDLQKKQDTFYRAFVRRGELSTKIEWVCDSAFRFFPVEPDLELGWRLSFWDAATNKVLALADRCLFRDYLDSIYLHQHHLSLGALAWAAAGKDPGMTPEFIVDWAKRSAKFRPEHLREVRLSQPVDLKVLKTAFLQAAAQAEALFERLPPAEMGCLYLNAAGRPVCPAPDSPEFPKLTRHFGSVKGAWPRIAEDQT